MSGKIKIIYKIRQVINLDNSKVSWLSLIMNGTVVFLMVNNNYNKLIKYNIIINYEYGQSLHLTSIIDIKNCVNLVYHSDLKKTC